MDLLQLINTISSPSVLFFIFIATIFLVYWIMTFTIFYHLVRFSVGTLARKIAIVFFLGSVILFSINFLFIASMNYETLIQKLVYLIKI